MAGIDKPDWFHTVILEQDGQSPPRKQNFEGKAW
jgi:hypothetical protein